MIKIRKNSGFTLIELLVVIAIIGILAAIALTSLRTARDKAKDASAIGSLSSARAQAEIFADAHGSSYTGLCTDGTATSTDLDINRLLASADNQLGGTAGGKVHCNVKNDGSSYTIDAALFDTVTPFFCVDAQGFAGKIKDLTSGFSSGDKCQG